MDPKPPDPAPLCRMVRKGGDSFESCASPLLATAIVFIFLEAIFTALRVFASRIRPTPQGLDDWLFWPALVANLTLGITCLVLIRVADVGVHFYDIFLLDDNHDSKMRAWTTGLIVTMWMYHIAACLPKLSILAFYLRIFKNVYKMERRFTYVLMILLTAIFISNMFVTGFICRPLSGWFRHDVYHCWDFMVYFRWMGYADTMINLCMILLPIRMVWNLQTTARVKVGVAMMLCTGCSGLLASLIRFVVFMRNDLNVDWTYRSVPLLVVTVLEPGIYFIAACMPTLKPVFARLGALSWFRSKAIRSNSTPALQLQPRTEEDSNKHLGQADAAGVALPGPARAPFTRNADAGVATTGDTDHDLTFEEVLRRGYR